MGFWRRLFGTSASERETAHTASTGATPVTSTETAAMFTAAAEWARCDVCGSATRFADGYALTTAQVVLAEGYWKIALTGAYKGLVAHDPKAATMLGAVIRQQADQDSAWLVCEKCSEQFEFDQDVAKLHARDRSTPPGAGPVGFDIAFEVAIGVRHRLFLQGLFGTKPTITQTGKERIDVVDVNAREIKQPPPVQREVHQPDLKADRFWGRYGGAITDAALDEIEKLSAGGNRIGIAAAEQMIRVRSKRKDQAMPTLGIMMYSQTAENEARNRILELARSGDLLTDVTETKNCMSILSDEMASVGREVEKISGEAFKDLQLVDSYMRAYALLERRRQ
jgi:hypothetical protein